MRREDMRVGQEYLISDERQWADREMRRSDRARLIDTGKWATRYIGAAGRETRTVQTMSGPLELPKRIQQGGNYDREVLVEVLDRDTGEPTGTYRAVPSANVKMLWSEGKAVVEENTKKREEKNAERRAAREEINRRIQSFHDIFETEQRSYYSGDDLVMISVDDAEKIMDMFGAGR